MSHLRDQYVIVGVGETEFGRLPHMSPMAIQVEAAKKAIEDAGLTIKDIDGVVGQPGSRNSGLWAIRVAQNLGILPLRYNDTCDQAGVGPCMLVQSAMGAIAAGLCDIVVCTTGQNELTTPREQGIRGWAAGGEFTAPFGLFGQPANYALTARRHMVEYGTKSEQFGAIAVAMRKHASLTHNAMMREPITLADHQESRMIADPFRLLDCCLVSDGGAAVVVTSADRAKDLRHPPVYISGVSIMHDFADLTDAASLTNMGAKESGRRAMEMAGVTPKEIDVAELYDNFTYTVLVTLEDYGFCEKGEGGAFVEGGRIELGGDLPVNTHGGLLSKAHFGMLHITEAVMQLRGECGLRQVNNAEIAIVSGTGGVLSSHSTMILRRGL
ncbi:MAG: thiolase family protein [Candidatus Tectomicrobia bacterium]|nr:thiolase family protein [Candidatus Tectomicrobia bacterium]